MAFNRSFLIFQSFLSYCYSEVNYNVWFAACFGYIQNVASTFNTFFFCKFTITYQLDQMK